MSFVVWQGINSTKIKNLDSELDELLSGGIPSGALPTYNERFELDDSHLIQLTFSLHDLMSAADNVDIPMIHCAPYQVVREPPRDRVDRIISPFSSASDISSGSYDPFNDSEYSEYENSMIMTCNYEVPVTTELHMAWDKTHTDNSYPIKTELEVIGYGYPIPRPLTPDMLNRMEKMNYLDLSTHEEIKVLEHCC